MKWSLTSTKHPYFLIQFQPRQLTKRGKNPSKCVQPNRRTTTDTSTGKMLPPMIIFKGTTNHCIQGIRGSNGILISYQKKAWLDENEILKWIRNIWIQHTNKQTSLLFLDSFSAHLTDRVKEGFKQCNATIVVIPGGCTSVLQPLDVSINKPVKAIL